ncbi:hypothetical protein WA026_014691 [Henosepilachna vigintioctopunctata]|uniref:RCR-type E3 ubiquitin transferase n=1 Tax=Henosepilachna vigintioctopunctata TaxID=420089 RepID=A0AAW1V8G9_9CUCU
MEEVFKVEVKEPPQGMTPPTQHTAKKAIHQPNKLRKFVAKNSAGLRIRAHPSLQSEQIGIVHVNGTIAFVDEIHNDDGVWLRLSMDTIKQYCQNGVIEAWCLQYNQHLGKTLLLPVEEPKTILDQVISDTIRKKLPEIHDRRKIPASAGGEYVVIKCGASGHNVRSKPNLKAPRVGMLILGNRIGVSEYTVNSDGCWVLLDQATKEKYCFNTEEEAWSLAMGHNNTLYLGLTNDDKAGVGFEELNNKGFDFTHTASPSSTDPHFSFGSPSKQSTSSTLSGEKVSTNPFIFGDSSNNGPPKVPKRERKDAKISGLSKWFKSTEDGKSESFDAPNHKEPLKPQSENRANGNGTPPDTPKRSQSPRSAPFSSKVLSRSSSPVPITARSSILDSPASSFQVPGSPKSTALSPLVSSGIPEPQPRRDSTNRILTRSENSPPLTPLTKEHSQDSDGSSKKLTQTGTQTSPENVSNVSMKGHFSIGSASREEKVSPKLARKDRGVGKIRPKRAISPAKMNQLPVNSKTYTSTEQAKVAMSPSLAESLRAVFASFLWHEGIVHDAMACASFLKFHPTLPKQGALVVTRHLDPPVDKRKQDLSKEERARQRHSVEVTTNAGSYLHIQPATLESLTRSAANANANRNRSKKLPSQSIKEEACSDKPTSSDRPGYTFHTVSVLPPALKSLVYLWEELSASCFQAITQQMIVQSPVQNRLKKNEKISNNTKNDCRDKNSTIEKESKKNRKKKTNPRNYLEDIGIPTFVASNDSETVCELCGESFPHPVTYHMHQAHPGCGQHAGGKGYNSGGNYCLGWAGNCGDGGVPGSSWYLLCESCREKYVKAYRSGKQFTNRVKNLQRRVYVKPVASPSLNPGLETHIIMRNNAMFLLDLASSSDTSMAPQRRSSNGYLPSLSENNSPPDCSGPFSPMPPFQCLQSLGVSFVKDEPSIYDVMMRKQNMQDGYMIGASATGQRPLSEVSDDNENKGLRFHRSISMGTNGIPWSKTGLDGRIIMTRKRNNSSSETPMEGGSSLLCNPSSALQHLIPKIDTSSTVVKKDTSNPDGESVLTLLRRPVMQFILQQHDLESLKLSMRQALRKAMCRVYAMQALNWLLKSVTQPLCLHDLLWWFVTALLPSEVEMESEDDNRPPKKLDEQDIGVCEHPLSDIMIAGDAVHPLPSTFHALLQTIANLMVLLPMGSPLQQMSVRCWGLRFATSDHSFLHRSQVFSNISKILSRSEELEDCTVSMHESHQSANQNACSVEALKDLTFAVEIKSSSRQAMVGSLTDGSTETFWESGDEDRNKTKCLILVSPQGHHPSLICVHLDNCRDLGAKVSNITFYSGPNSDELVKQRSVEVETRLLGGWVNCPIPDNNDNVVKIELKGPDNSVRVRQIRLLGSIDGESLKVGKQYSSYTIQQRNCEAETLRVFRLITSQVFGKLIEGESGQKQNNQENAVSGSESLEPLEESNDLREHMVGILFSRSKLTHLQKQVIVHIVQAIRKETIRVRDEWENLICSPGGLTTSDNSQDIIKNSDTYCFEMLSMVLALSGSSVGRAYLSHQGGLLGDLLSLLHTGSARVQRQVTSLLRRMLPEITPDTLAKVMGVTSLPPKDFNVVLVNNKAMGSSHFDIHRTGILDVFLSVIAKSLTVQVKLKGKTGGGNAVKEINTVTLATSIHPKDNLGSGWWLKGSANRKLAEVIVSLIKDMAAGKLSDTWAKIAKGAIAESILNLTHLSEEQRIPSVCLRTPTLWLALASLCVLDKDHVDRLSSGQWTNPEGQPAPPRPTCTNHDDGETNAVIQCNICGNLCADCDRFLHLHRKTRAHQRQVCKEEEEAIKVELHEGCGRTKLFWLLALADARTLKALIEYREGGTRSRGAGTSGVCRFCSATGTSGLLAIGNVCADQECQEYSKTACTKLLNCGHMCGGIIDEANCLPCLHGCTNDPNLRQDADDMCMICFTEALSCAPAIQLKCGHVFHLHCCKAVLMKKWAGPRITFSFSQCPICKENMEHPTLEELLEPIQKLLKDVKRKALMRLEYEGLHTVDAIVIPGARFYNDASSYAMDRYAYYVCFKCNKAYYGGEARCDAEVGENYDPTELVCGACSDVARAQMCPKHGTDFLEYKCRYCCSVAVFFCFGTTHFCNPCHDDFQRVTNLAKSELPNCPTGPKAKQLEGDECPLHIKHPPTGEEFALGCGVCRNAHTF